MAGHSKWANIQHRKNAQDAKRGKLFTKLIREITVSASQGGADTATNPRLRTAVDKALSNNMTRDTVERAIKRGAGGAEGKNIASICYEGYGPGGVAVLVECLTDNRNRTAGEVRHAFTKSGGNLGTEGSVSYLFSKRGMITFAPGKQNEKILEIALEQDVLDVIDHEDLSVDVIIEPSKFEMVKKIFDQKKLNYAHADVTLLAATQVSVEEETQEKINKLIEMLEDLDDVQDVYTNCL
ncbi:MAG: hypothetical protein A3B69_05015 [Gammaproteobacteria bacterium RIFCSPHIGHO2_02_FULL_38_33]|nr:MAG: hypothetical protein A3B69_05015 [Gammaproteobacteria bacterium RIFCSPHIGHO2_02_FULL_38_33]OGT24027.1 MAG: hypothetical protein A2W47_05245 [Gammaproteobacteria bacterium RIFCSPHIGHO2_12_38_15]